MSLNSAAEDIRTILNTNGGFGVSGVDLFSIEWGTAVGGDEVHKQIAIFDTEDIDALVKDSYENSTFLILVRGDTAESSKAVHDRARVLYQFMLQEARQTINGVQYLPFAPLGGLVPTGTDNNNRVVYSMKFFTFRQSLGDST